MTNPTEETGQQERAFWRVRTLVEKWSDPQDWEAGRHPDEVVEDQNNILTSAGITRMLSLLIGAGGQAFSNAWARLGVGNGGGTPAAANTDLAGASRLFKAMDSGYPTLSGTVLTFRSTYQDGEANFTWSEWGIDLGGAGSSTSGTTVGAPLLNRRVPPTNLGTKSGGVWTLTTQITIT